MRSRRRGTSRMWKVAGWASVVVTAALVVGLLVAYSKYRAVWGSIKRVAISDLGHRPPKYTDALNILVFGSDNRNDLTLHQETVWHVGRNQGEANTDTVMIVHISPGRHLVTVLSIPRDTMVPYYGCAKGAGWPGQQADLTAYERINAVMAAGGPSCLWKTVEQETGIRIDHFIELDFSGFVHVVNALGGVSVCVPFNVNDPVSGLKLRKGEHHINGVTALKFWRTREDIGTGSDLQRIKRDQFLMSQLVQGVLHGGLLSSPSRLLAVITDTAKAMTTDSGLTQSALLHIAASFRGLSSKDVQFVTAPNQPFPGDPSAEVEFAQPTAHELFAALAHDKRLPKHKSGTAKHGKKHTPAPVASPGDVTVTVLNGSGSSGQAATAAADLAGRGFQIAGTGDAGAYNYTASVIEYGSASQLPQARALREVISGAHLKKVASLPTGTLDLITGSTFSGLTSHTTPQPSPSTSVSKISKNYGGITASASCKSDSGAFTGPLSP